MLRQINVGVKSLADYHSIVSHELMTEIRDLAHELRDLRVCHVNATSFGGGVAEILYSLVPLMNDVGLHADWRVMFGREEFFNVTKAMHNALQGSPRTITAEEQRTFERYNLVNAGGLDGDYDVVIIHDPQPIGIRGNTSGLDTATWIWRCHIDLSDPNPQVLEYLRPMMAGYDATVFHMPQYVPQGTIPHPVIIPPAIDPLRRRTWRSRPRTQRTSSISSASTSSAHCCCRSPDSTRGRTRWVSSTRTASSPSRCPGYNLRW